MKKVGFLCLAIIVFTNISIAQVFTSGFESWSDPNSPDGWMGSATHTTNLTVNNSADAFEGSLSCQLVTSGTSHRRFSTQPVAVTAGTVYTITFYIKGGGEVRTGLVNAPFGGTDYQTYNNYVQATSAWTMHSQNITASLTGDAQFIFSVLNTVEPTHLLLDNVTITAGGSSNVDYVSIYDIQYTTAMSGDSPYVGQTVETSGIVTATYASGYFIQNGVGPWTGVHVFNNSNTPQIGDSISIIGNVVEYFNLTQITSVTSFVNHSSGNTLPVAVEITSAQSKTEPYEGVLVKVMNAECTNVNSGFGMWKINSGVDSSKVHNLFYAYTPILGASYNIRGVINYSFSEFRVCPRNINDIEVLNANVNDVSIYEIQFTTAADGASPLVGQTVTTSGIVTATVSTASNTGFFIQDGVGPWNGIFVANNSINPTVGDEIELTGVVGESFGLTRISGVSGHTIVSSGNTLPAPTVISTQAASTEPYESVLIRVQNTTCTNTNAGFGMFRVNDGSGDALVDDELFSFTPVLGNGYNVQGLLWFSFGEFKIWPRFASDIETIGFASLEGNELNQVVLYPNPAEETLNVLNYEGQVLVLDAQGRVILVNEVSAAQNQINVANLVAGVYFAVIDGQTIRFVKR
jgi:hypothetical protein